MKISKAITFLIFVVLLANLSLADEPEKEISEHINYWILVCYCVLMFILCGVAAIIIVLSGIRLFTNEDIYERKEAKKRARYAVIALVFILIACPLVNFLIEGGDVKEFKCNCPPGKPPTTKITPVTTTIGGITSTTTSTTVTSTTTTSLTTTTTVTITTLTSITTTSITSTTTLTTTTSTTVTSTTTTSLTTTTTTSTTTTTTLQVNCYTLREFSDGSKEKRIIFPDGGGSNSDAKITLPKGANVCDARVDVSVLSGENSSCYLETRASCSISGSGFKGVAKLDNEIILALTEYEQGRIGMYCDMTTHSLLSSSGCDVLKWLGKKDNPRVFTFGYPNLCSGPLTLPYTSAENLANDYDVVIYCGRDAPIDSQTVSVLQSFTRDYGKGLMIIGDYYRPGVSLNDADFENLNKLSSFVNSQFNKVSLSWGTARGYYIEMDKLDIGLDIGSDNTKEYHNPYLSDKDRISDLNTAPKFTTKLTELLKECNCPGCILSAGNSCTIDLKFSAKSKGEIKLSDLYIYYCLNQCP